MTDPNPFQPIFAATIQPLLWVFPALFTLAGLKLLFSAWFKGMAGERAVARVLDRLGQDALHDIIIPDGQGGLTQLDHVVLIPAGLLVVETKNYQGNIFGQPKDKTWTQRLGKKSFKFGNPLRQNYLHTQAVKALVPGVPVYGQVAFTNVARFPKGVPEGVSALKTLKADLGPLLQADPVDPLELNVVWQQVQEAARTDRETRQAHLAGIQAKHGKDYRKPVAIGLLIVATLWAVALLLLK
ncbi:MAG: nuclease-related domain-containing protein [Candidatus Competibacteraceae bacterium]|jgi:hypothetical protein|nr:nuclease-related domain-containing protein [Candidatus Competibacteraceae bacterium]